MRLGHTASNHIEENKLVFKFELDPEDLARIQDIQRKGKVISNLSFAFPAQDRQTGSYLTDSVHFYEFKTIGAAFV